MGASKISSLVPAASTSVRLHFLQLRFVEEFSVTDLMKLPNLRRTRLNLGCRILFDPFEGYEELPYLYFQILAGGSTSYFFQVDRLSKDDPFQTSV
ncbi:hypothetical protein Tco_1152900 [Tanacetum coccineum]